MLRTIMVPLDGSAWSEQALPLAQRIAQQAEARLVLAHVHVPVVNVYVGMWNVGGVPVVNETLDAEARSQERTYLSTIQHRLAHDTAMEVSTALLDEPVGQTLVEFAEDQHADLVVMTTHGRNAFSRFWLGGVADELIRHSYMPTLLVRPHQGQLPQPNTLQRMLIPLDGSPLSTQILQPAAALARVLHMNMTLIQVIEPLHVAGYVLADAAAIEQQYMQSRCSEAQAYLKGLAAPLQAEGINVETHTIVADQAAPAVLQYAKDHGSDMIALATHGRGGLRRLMIGSVADKLIRGAEGPVLVFRPHADA